MANIWECNKRFLIRFFYHIFKTKLPKTNAIFIIRKIIYLIIIKIDYLFKCAMLV